MEKIWKFLNSAFISALVAGLLILWADRVIEKREIEDSKQLLSRIDKLSDSVEKLLFFKNITEKYLHEHKDPVEKPSDEKRKIWKKLLDVSWGKKNDRYLVKKFASFMNKEVPFYVNVDWVKEKESKISILNEDLSLNKSQTLKENEHYNFDYNDNKFRLNLLYIKGAGFLGSDAAYFTIDVLTYE